jgi:hypothetical protein
MLMILAPPAGDAFNFSKFLGVQDIQCLPPLVTQEMQANLIDSCGYGNISGLHIFLDPGHRTSDHTAAS